MMTDISDAMICIASGIYSKIIMLFAFHVSELDTRLSLKVLAGQYTQCDNAS